jgi:uncharacterized membrane protein YbhN (UPF0104 family)
VVEPHPNAEHWWSGWRIFSTADPAAPERRPTDAVLFVTASLLVGWTLWRADPPTRLDTALGEAFGALPSFFQPLWQVLLDLIVVWCLVLVVAAGATRRVSLLLQFFVAATLALAAVAVTGRLALSEWPNLFESFFDDDGPPIYPATRVAVGTALAAVASPFLSRPFRRLGRFFIGAAAVAGVALRVTLPGGSVGGFAIGLGVATLIRLALGSPGWRPDTESLVRALRRVGLDLHDEGPATFGDGVAYVPARDQHDRRLSLQVHGRDAWQGQFFNSLFRFLAYRDSGPNFTTGRFKQVEHEAFLNLLAERTGASVAATVTTAETDAGDAVLVVEHPGDPIAPDGAPVLSATFVAELWKSLQLLHGVAIAHGRVDHNAVLVDAEGRGWLTNFSAASVSADPELLCADNAQMLTLSAVLVGPERAIDEATTALGSDGMAALVPFLQRPVMTPMLRRVVKSKAVDLDELRARAAAAGGIEEPELAKLRRVTWGSLLQVALIAIAAWVVLSAISSVGLSTLWDTLSTAMWPWVIAAIILSQSARLPAGIATMGATLRVVRLWPAVALDFAIAFVNLAIPATAARVAVKIRFFQRHGASGPEALSIGVLDSVANTMLQVAVLIIVPLLGMGSLDLDVDVNIGDHVPLIIGIVAAIVALVLATIFVERLRNLVVPPIRKMTAAFGVLRSPQKVLMLFGGNLGAQVGFALGFWASLHAFGASLGIVELVFINAAVSLVAGLLPIPGGIGVSEAGLAAGLVAFGISNETAIAAAVLYRITSFYLPPLIGVVCFKWLERNNYL